PMLPTPPTSPLFPYTTLFRSNGTVIIAAGNDRLFAKLGAALGHPEWATDPRFVTNAERRAHREELIVEMERVLTARTKGEWIDIDRKSTRLNSSHDQISYAVF